MWEKECSIREKLWVNSLVINLVFSRAGELFTYLVMICKSICCILKSIYSGHNSKKQKCYEISVILDI